MRITIILILLLIPILTFSQTNSSIDFIIGGEYSFRTINSDSKDFNTTIVLESREQEKPKPNFRIGFNYNRRLARNFHIKSGVRWSSIGYLAKKETDIRWGSEFNGQQWTPDPNLPHELKLTTDYWYLEFPVIGRYEFNNKKISPFVELGVSPNIYLTTRTKLKTDIGTTNEFNDYTEIGANRFALSASISFGVNIKITEKLGLFTQPIFRYHLTQFFDAPIEEHLYNYGLEVGLRRHL